MGGCGSRLKNASYAMRVSYQILSEEKTGIH